MLYEVLLLPKSFSFWLYFGLQHIWKQTAAKCVNMFLTFVCLLFSPCKLFLLFFFELKQYPNKKRETLKSKRSA